MAREDWKPGVSYNKMVYRLLPAPLECGSHQQLHPSPRDAMWSLSHKLHTTPLLEGFPFSCVLWITARWLNPDHSPFSLHSLNSLPLRYWLETLSFHGSQWPRNLRIKPPNICDIKKVPESLPKTSPLSCLLPAKSSSLKRLAMNSHLHFWFVLWDILFTLCIFSD